MSPAVGAEPAHVVAVLARYVPALFPASAGTGTLRHVRWGLCVAWLTGAGAALAVVATVTHALVNPAPEAGVAQAVMFGAPVLACPVAGLVIATRAPGNRVGGLLLVSACALALYAAAVHVRAQGLASAPDAPLTAWAALWVHSGWPTFYIGLVGLAFLFPDGRLASPRWRPIAAAVALAFGGFLALALFDPRPYSLPFDDLPKPLPVADVAEALIVGEYVLLAPLLVAVAAVVVRYRRSSGLARAHGRLRRARRAVRRDADGRRRPVRGSLLLTAWLAAVGATALGRQRSSVSQPAS